MELGVCKVVWWQFVGGGGLLLRVCWWQLVGVGVSVKGGGEGRKP